jgi:hypothetical protein
MKIEALPDDLVDILLEDVAAQTVDPRPEQTGPLRQYDTTMRCACRGCSSPTFFKIQGIPRCMIHALRELNYMLVQRGVEK